MAIAGTALAIAATAQAASTRAEYVAQVDPICQAGHAMAKSEARTYRKRVRPFLKHGFDQYDPPAGVVRLAVRYYAALVRIRRGVSLQAGAVPAAPGDEATVSRWLQLRDQATDLLEQSTRVLHHRKIRRFVRYVSRAARVELDAEGFVADFGFSYCTPYVPSG